MAELLHSTDLTQFRAFTSGDEPTLVKIYRAHFDAMVAQSREALGPDLAHFSGRVAQQAMLTVWDQRAKYEDLGGLTSALEGAIRDEAARQRRKRGALHHGNTIGAHAPHVAIPTADEAVEQLLAQLHTGPADHEKAQTEAAIARKHHAAAHVQNVGKGRGWVVPVVLVLVLGAVIVAGMRWMGASSEDAAASKALRAEDTRTISAARGQRGSVPLADGSKVRIGSESKIRVPADFGVLIRTLELTGTANFTVAAGNPRAFVVRAGNASITATGTQFTVRAFALDSAVYIGVDEGSVSVRTMDGGDATTVAAGKSMRMAPDGSVAMLDDAAREVALSWAHDTLVFNNAPVKTILPALMRWYDLQSSVAEPALGERTVSLRIGLQSSGDALKALASEANLAIGFDKGLKVVLKDNPAGASKAKLIIRK